MKKELERREYLFDISAEETEREGIRTITGRPIDYQDGDMNEILQKKQSKEDKMRLIDIL